METSNQERIGGCWGCLQIHRLCNKERCFYYVSLSQLAPTILESDMPTQHPVGHSPSLCPTGKGRRSPEGAPSSHTPDLPPSPPSTAPVMSLVLIILG